MDVTLEGEKDLQDLWLRILREGDYLGLPK
jgi:hypothetical protein